ncbi:MAG: hypothetical protein EA349_15920 [Halomonadaceae bacterium]|nr:MAG: hypothetical protein EA349_15920 [Halomonadaceae bacterium]
MGALLRSGLILSVILLTGCLGSSSSSSDDPSPGSGPGPGSGDDGYGDVVDQVTLQGATTGRVQQGLVEASSWNGSGWDSLGEPTHTDEQGRFELVMPGVDQPVLIQLTQTSHTLRRCDAPSGCGEVNFGNDFSPGEDFSLTAIIPGASLDENSQLTLSSLTTLAAVWAQNLPPAISNAGADLALSRLTQLLALDQSLAAVTPPDLADASALSAASTGERRYAYLDAALDELAQAQDVSSEEMVQAAGILFSALGGQLPVSGLDLDGSPVVDFLTDLGLDLEALWPELTNTEFTLPGLEEWLNAAIVVAEAYRGNDSDSAMLATLLNPWEDRNLTALVGSAGFVQADMDRALALVNDFTGYWSDAQDASQGIDPNHRGLGWLYAGETAVADTTGMMEVLGESLGFAIEGAVCVPSRKNSLPCSIGSPYASLVNMGSQTYRVDIAGEWKGQTVSLTASAEDIRELVTDQGQMPITIAGSISNDTATLNLDVTIDLDLSGNDLPSRFQFNSRVALNPNYLDSLMAELLADLWAGIRVSGELAITAADSDIGTYSLNNIDTRLTIDRSVITQNNQGPLLDLQMASGERTNPAGEKLSTVSGEDGLRLIVDNGVSLSTAYITERLGLPPITVMASGDLSGGEELAAVLGDLLDIVLSEDGDLADIDLDPLLAVLTPDLLDFAADASVTVNDPNRGNLQYRLKENTSGSGLALTSANSEETALVLHTPGVAVVITSGNSLIGTVHPGVMGDELLLALVNGEAHFFKAPEQGQDDLGQRFNNIVNLVIALFEALVPDED